MTPAEAIELINKVTFSVENEIEEIKASKFITALKTAISALEKQIPKKPKLMDKPLINSKRWFYCPNCNASRHTDIKVNHCSYCGQALDWSDTE